MQNANIHTKPLSYKDSKEVYSLAHYRPLWPNVFRERNPSVEGLNDQFDRCCNNMELSVCLGLSI